MKKLTMLCLVLMVSLPQSVRSQSSRILVFAKTKGYYHTSIPKGMKTILSMCKMNGIAVDTTRDAAVFTRENLKQYRVVVFLSTTGDVLDNAQQESFIGYIQSGGGFVGIHSATDTEYEWPWYNKLAGAYFLSHPAQQNAVIRVNDKKNPAMSMLPDEWKRWDEWYNFRNISPEIHVLASLDEKTYEGGKNGDDHPFIWCQEFDGGRAFYTGVGHTEESFDEPLVQQHLMGAIRWAGKMK